MNTKLSAQLFGLGLLVSATACGSRTSLMQDDAGAADAGEQTSSVTSSSSGGRGGSGTTSGRAGSAAPAAGRGGAAGGAARAGRGGSAAGKGGAGSAAEGGAGGKVGTGGEGGAGGQGGKGGGKAPEGGKGGEGGAGGEGGGKEPEAGKGGAGGEGGAGGSAGSAGMAAAGSGGSDGAKLTMLSGDQKTALCARIDDGTRDLSLSDAVRGYCSSIGVRNAGMCTEVRDMCVDGPAVLPVCADTIPDCPMITEDEFVNCRIDQLEVFSEYNKPITCDSEAPGTVGEHTRCNDPYTRCPQLRDLAR